MVRALVVFALVGLSACKTPRQKDDTVILVDPNEGAPGSTSAVTAGSSSGGGSILGEQLQPVRGGARVLPPYRGPDPCRMALLGESPVAKACSDGGLRRANELMQTFVRRARAEGIFFECTDCHPDDDDFSKLAAQADAEFRKLLFLARPGD